MDQSSVANSPKSPCILVVEDDDAFQQLIDSILTDDGYRVILASDGGVALDLAAEHHPDLILLDMYMPQVDGWSFLAAYPKTPPPHAPVIAMSAAVEVKNMMGVVAGITKPFTIDRLLTAVHKVLPKAESSTS